MIFPILHIPGLGDGMTIALDAILHVFISHGLAIGLASMLVLFQTLTWLGKGAFWAQISRSLLGPVVVITTSIGAVTGVGIWFITGALAPEGIGSLIHLFFWPWFIEWGAFTTEVVLLLIYYYLWDRLAQDKPGVLAALGWGYVAVAVSSAFLISGILGFMLTPDGWPWGQTFREAYFNPTFIPQFLLRVAGGLSLGSLCLLGWTAWRYKGPRLSRRGPGHGRVRLCLFFQSAADLSHPLEVRGGHLLFVPVAVFAARVQRSGRVLHSGHGPGRAVPAAPLVRAALHPHSYSLRGPGDGVRAHP